MYKMANSCRKSGSHAHYFAIAGRSASGHTAAFTDVGIQDARSIKLDLVRLREP